MAVQISGNDITVPRDTTVTRNLTVGGVLTYEDVTNVDSVGLVTARSGIEIGARPGVAASISVDGNMIISGISTFAGDVQLQSDLSIVDKIIHTGDTDTAIRFPAADTITAETGGSERLRIDSDGDVLVGGHSAPLTTYQSTQTRLSIHKSSGSGAYLELGGAQNTNGTSAGSILFVNDNNADGANNDADGKILAMQRVEIVTSDSNAGDDSGGDLVFMTKPESGTLDTRLRIGSDGSSSFSGSVYMSNDNQILYLGAGNDFRLFHNGTTNQIYGNGSHDLLFLTNQTERVRITSGGNLEVKATGADANRSIKIEGTNGSSELQQVVLESDGENGKFFINAAAGNGTPTDKFTINTITGHVGVNTVSPLDGFQINQAALRMLSHAVGGGSGTHCHYLHFPVFMSSGTKQIATVSNFDTATTCFAKIDYVTLYGYAGTNMGGGSRHAYLRRTNSDTDWRQINNQANGNSDGDNHHPNIFFTNNVLYVDIPGSVQLTGFMTVVASNCTLTRDVDITD